MRNVIVLLSFVVLSSSFASTALAQPSREAYFVDTHRDVSVAPHLTDESMELEAPEAGDYVLPVLGVVLGGASVLAGLAGVLGSALVLAVHHEGPTNATVWLGGSAALAAVGAISLGVSIAELRNLHHRASDAETGVRVLQFTPTADGAMVAVAGTF